MTPLLCKEAGDWTASILLLEEQCFAPCPPILHDHPHVTQANLCLDNGKGGMRGMEQLDRLFGRTRY